VVSPFRSRSPSAAISLGFMIGVGGATGKLYGGPILRDLLDVYTTLVRAVPELVLILLLYYAGTDALNQLMLGCSVPNGWTSAVWQPASS
jgi:ABC-type arginine transport system permease subunit